MITADMIKWSVYTTGTRDISNIQKAVPQVRVVYDRIRNNYDTFRQGLKSAGNYPLVLMEDDIDLCENFQARVLEEINLRPNDFITFFSGGRNYYGSHYLDMTGMGIVWIQCFYYPPKMAAEFLRFTYLWRDRVRYNTGTDRSLATFIRMNQYKCYQVIPNLVQHRQVVSEIYRGRSTHRTSPNFIG